ncbi:hypothetical protein LUZ61_019694 [Rhynchospora tenuis]|uniref:Ubiquitin-like domain-containing protein n=1 Tax=Rhynchospora tenuis TaxID=198213 RepID=A0AAD5ZBV8_9POAL|nr:hypothetical protein LUZ61_019694 [Rhynchospora tenuis]
MRNGTTKVVKIDCENPVEDVKVHLKSKMQIFVIGSHVEKIPLTVEGTQTVGSLKAMIQNAKNISADDIFLCLNYKKLDDSRTLADYGIHEYSTIVIHSMVDLKIHINTWEGKTFFLDTDSSETVANLKKRIADQEGIPQNKQKLMFREYVLTDSRTLADCNIKNKSTLDLYLCCGKCMMQHGDFHDHMGWQDLVKNFKGDMLISIHDLVGKTGTSTLQVERSDTIDHVKAKIQDITGIPSGEMVLIVGDILLNGHRTLADYGIEKEDILYVLVSVSGC